MKLDWIHTLTNINSHGDDLLILEKTKSNTVLRVKQEVNDIHSHNCVSLHFYNCQCVCCVQISIMSIDVFQNNSLLNGNNLICNTFVG